MSIDYGGPMMIVPQITLHGFIGFGSLDVPFFEDMEFMSSDLGSVWWEPADGFSYLILGNSSSMPVVANVSYASGETELVKTGPFATVVKPVSYREDQGQSDDGRVQIRPHHKQRNGWSSQGRRFCRLGENAVFRFGPVL